MDRKPNIAILGAGVVGMTVANLITDTLDCNVTMIAHSWRELTTSYVAAGIFRPGTSFKGPTPEITKKWMLQSWEYYNNILKSANAEKAGIMTMPTYVFSKDNPHVTRNHFLEGLVPIYRPATKDELKLGPNGTKYGCFFSTLKVDTKFYVPYIEGLLAEKGGVTYVDKDIYNYSSVSEVGNFDVVFNCLGLGAKFLCNDHDLVPIRGQVIKVKAPWVKHAYYVDYDTYIIPGADGEVTLGGVRQYDSYNMDICKHDTAAMMERCCEVLPRLKDAKVLRIGVGLRPLRVPVRVESEIVDGMKVVHCYGHGGYGVMTAPGTAMDAVDIGLDLLKMKPKSKL